jgi:hypothetical protein
MSPGTNSCADLSVHAVVSDLVNIRRALCAIALVAGLALTGCGQSKTANSASDNPQGATSASPGATASGSPAPGGANGGGGNTGGGGAAGGSSGGSGSGNAPKPGAPPECTEIATTPGLHDIGDTLDQMDAPDTAAAAKTKLQSDAGQITTIASHTGDGTLKSRLSSFATAITNVANSGTDNMGTMMTFATSLRDVSQSAQDICGLTIG